MSRRVGGAEETRQEHLRIQALEHLRQLRREGVWGLELPVPAAAAVEAPRQADAAGPRDPDRAPVPESLHAGAEAPREAALLYGDGQDGLFGDGGPPPDDETLKQIETEALGCVACRLHEGRNRVVFGVGNPEARLMFIGEGPGRDEDLQGEPFVGRAGQLLTKIIAAMGYERGDVYIANVVKCRPPQNRNPQADEMKACEHFLLRQIAVIRPQIIVLLGRIAVQAILESSAPMSRLRGRFQRWRGIPVMCTYHPAYLLRNPNAKKDVWEDMQMVRDALAGGSE